MLDIKRKKLSVNEQQIKVQAIKLTLEIDMKFQSFEKNYLRYNILFIIQFEILNFTVINKSSCQSLPDGQ